MFCNRCYRRYDASTKFCPHDGEALAERPDIARLRGRCIRRQKGFIGERYMIRGVLGRGDMAQVYLAEERHTHEPAAVKVLDTKRVKDAETKARFMVEANAILKVQHPRVVKVYDVGLRSGGAPYIAMEFLFGETVRAYLERNRKFKIELGFEVLRDVLDGIGAAHRAGVVHRDIKPGNLVLIGPTDGFYETKVVDFGMARIAEISGITRHGVAVGTLEYMAPEQAVGDPPDARSDVYGLGSTMYRMFSGRLPFPAGDESLVLAHHLYTTPPALKLGASPEAKRLEAVVHKAMRKDPAQRYASVDALRSDLDRVLDPSQSLSADAPMDGPNVYEPVQAFSQNAAQFLRRQLED